MDINEFLKHAKDENGKTFGEAMCDAVKKFNSPDFVPTPILDEYKMKDWEKKLWKEYNTAKENYLLGIT